MSFLRFCCSFHREGICFENMASAAEAMGSRESPGVGVGQLQGFRCLKGVRGLLGRLHDHADHPNRLLHYDEYATLLLFYFFNATVTSLRGLRKLTCLAKVRKELGIKRTSLGSLSEASQVFDPELLRRMFEDLAGRAVAKDGVRRPKGFPDDLDLIASDGSVLEALPRMVWALWLRKEHNGVRLHLDFDVLRGVPVAAEVTTARASETARLRKRLAPGRLYVIDRGLADYGFFQDVIDADSSFVGRVQENAVYEVIEEREVTEAARAAGVVFDRVVKLGGKVSGAKLAQPVRIVKVVVKNEPTRALRFRRKRVSSKKTFRTGSETHELLLVTDRLDLSAELIALLYKYRWRVELFFKWLKCVLGCRHLVAESGDGVRIQVYAALIASLLIVLWTERKPTKRTFEMLQFYFLGWASEQELQEHIAGLGRI
jgi:hypothetical protein